MDGSGELLNKDQMKKVIGGDYGKCSTGTCTIVVNGLSQIGNCAKLTQGCYCVYKVPGLPEYHQELSSQCNA